MDEKKYKRGLFTPSDEYNTAVTNKNSASSALTALGDGKWHYGKDANGNPVLGDDILNGYLNDYNTRDKFTYDLNSDALYQQYKDQHMTQGKLAMEDTMGQAAAMTGGYGNSYAATVGNQAYQSYLGKLNDVIPELYQLAYDKYNQDGQDLLTKIGLLQSERDNHYTRYNEDYNRALGMMNYYSTEANNLYNRDYSAYSNDEVYKYNTYRDSVQDAKDAEQMAFAKQQYEDSKYVNAGGQYKVSIDENGKPVVVPNVDAIVNGEVINTNISVSDMLKKAWSYQDKAKQADYLAAFVNAGVITGPQAQQIMAGQNIISLTDREWDDTYNGGFNWWGGVNDNAIVKDQFGNKYTLEELKKELEKTMSSEEAKQYIMELQDKLEI